MALVWRRAVLIKGRTLFSQETRAHDAAVSKVSWAHPEFGPIIASSSFDRTVKIWEQTTVVNEHQEVNGTTSTQPSSSRWVERAVLLDARGTVRAVEFAPHHFGLKLATISTDNFLRIYECLEQPSLATWQLSEEVDVLSIPSSPSALHSRAHTVALATPTQTHASLDGASASLVAQALLQQQTSTPSRPGLGNREADGGWCISWCKDRYWGEIIAAGCGINGLIKVIQMFPSRRPTTLLVLDPNTPQVPLNVPALPSKEGGGSPSGSPSQGQDSEQPTPHSVVSVSWAPSCGRSYHLIATGGRDGRVRIWKVKPAVEQDDVDEMEEVDAQDESRWNATLVADHDDHK
ncbi:epoxide hydrolase, soluble (sEH) [Marasmius sp. AFHP31]|nr:epoxide hydrolase, soluble (sEH) [Marasmius sp. AFHP31]